MYDITTRHQAYKRATYYVIIYSIYFFYSTSATFMMLKTIIYFPIAFLLSGAVAAFLMHIQFNIEKKMNPKLWFINIFIDIIGYYYFVRILFKLFYL